MAREIGGFVRKRRLQLQATDPNYSLRRIAKRIGVQPAYLSRLERGQTSALTEEKLMALALALAEDSDSLLAMAGKVASDVLDIIKERPALFGALIRRLRGLSDSEITALEPSALPQHSASLMVEHLPAGAVFIEGNALAMNKAAEAITGYAREDILTVDAWFETLYGERAAPEHERYDDIKAQGFPRRVIAPITTRDGETRLVEYTGYSQGSQTIWIMNDVTAQARAVEALRRSEEKFRFVYEKSPNGIVLFDNEGVIQACNRQLAAIMGVDSSDSYLGWNMLRAMRDETAAIAIQTALHAGAAVFEGPYRSVMSERELFLRVEFARIAPGLYMGVFVDLTETRRAAAALERSEKKYRELVENLQEGVVAIDAMARTTFVNPRMAAMLGYEAEEMLGRLLFEFLDPGQLEQAKRHLDPRRQGIAEHYDIGFVKKDGSLLLASVSSAPILDAHGNFQGSIAAIMDVTERKLATARLQHSEALLREAQAVARLGSFELDMQSGQGAWSDELYRILGLDPALTPPLVESFFPHLHPDDRDSVMHSRAEAVAKGEAEDRECRFLRADGEIRNLRLIRIVECDASGAPNRLYGIIQDITDLRRVQQALEDSEARFRGAFEHAPNGILLVDTEGAFNRANRRFCDFLGYSEPELVSKSIVELTYPEDVPASLDFFRRLLKQEIDTGLLEKRYLRKDGAAVWALLSVAAVRDAQANILYFISNVIDISDRKRMEEALHASKELYETLADAVPENVAVIDRDGVYRFANAATCRLLQRETADILGKTEADLFAPDVSAQHVATTRGVLDTGLPWAYLECIDLPDRRVWFDTRVVPLRDKDGTPNAVLISAHDITDLKLMEEQLLAAKLSAEQAYAAKSLFLANMSHELRTPLTGVMGGIQMILDTPLDSDQCETLNMCLTAARSLLAIVNDVLDLSKIEARKLDLANREFKLDALLDEATRLFRVQARQKGLGFALNLDPAASQPLWGDPDRLAQVLGNLCSNAVKFTETGRIDITAAPTQRAGLAPCTVEWIFTVKDTGIGIPDDKLPLLFQNFTQLDGGLDKHFGGIGLGLAISKRLVEMMGGAFHVESQPGRGSLFACSVILGLEGDPDATVLPVTQPVARSMLSSPTPAVDEIDPSFLPMFRDELEFRLLTMRAHLEQGEHPKIAAAARSLKNIAATVGANAVRQAAAAVETAWQSNDPWIMDEALKTLEREAAVFLAPPPADAV